MLIAVLKHKFILLFILIFGTLSFPIFCAETTPCTYWSVLSNFCERIISGMLVLDLVSRGLVDIPVEQSNTLGIKSWQTDSYEHHSVCAITSRHLSPATSCCRCCEIPPPPELFCLLTRNPNPNTNCVLNSPTLPQTPTPSPSPDPNHNPHKRRHSRWKLSQELKKANTCYIFCKVHMCGIGQS